MDVKVPALAESDTEGEIGTWLKKDGDSVKKGEAVVELQTDKASLELSAEASGVLRTLRAEGETVKVGEVIARIEEGGAAERAPKAEPPAAVQPASAQPA